MAEKPESDSTVKAYWLWLYIQLLVQKNSVDSLTPELRPNSVCCDSAYSSLDAETAEEVTGANRIYPHPLVVRELVTDPKVEPVMRMVSVPVAVSVVVAGIVAVVVVRGIIAVAAVGAPQVMFIGLDDGERIRLFPD